MFLADQAKMEKTVPLLREIIQRRFSQASSLGYASHAAFKMQRRRLLGTPERVKGFLSDLAAGLVPRGRKELEVLRRRRLSDIEQSVEEEEEEEEEAGLRRRQEKARAGSSPLGICDTIKIW